MIAAGAIAADHGTQEGSSSTAGTIETNKRVPGDDDGTEKMRCADAGSVEEAIGTRELVVAFALGDDTVYVDNAAVAVGEVRSGGWDVDRHRWAPQQPR